MGVDEKLVLRSYLNVTKNISGCQALRSKIGHILFGFRCVYGECIFVTVSPNRRHSSLILRLSRARRNDTMLSKGERDSDDRTKDVAYWQRRYASAQEPHTFSTSRAAQDQTGEDVTREIELPPLLTR